MTLSRLILRGSAVLGTLAGLLCFVRADAQAVEHLTREQAAPIYMNCSDFTRGGESARGKGWIELQSFQLGSAGTTRNIDSATGGAGAGKIRFNEFKITKMVDKASPSFYRAASGKHDNCTVNFDRPNTSATQPYMTINFENVFISSYHVSGVSSGGDRPTESISFNFTKVEYKDNVQTGRSGTNLLAPPNALEIAKPKPSPSPSPVQPK
jgi:type VI secretion system secreted protein Hcp